MPLTSVVCKIAEKIVKSRVTDFWQNINIFNPKQFAYMEGRSTLSEILSCYDDWAKSSNITTESQPTSPFWIFPRCSTAYRMSVFFSSVRVMVHAPLIEDNTSDT